MTELTAIHDNRSFQLSVIPGNFPAVEADLIARGYDGKSYIGESKGTGKQRVRTCLFLRRADDGAFVNALGR